MTMGRVIKGTGRRHPQSYLQSGGRKGSAIQRKFKRNAREGVRTMFTGPSI